MATSTVNFYKLKYNLAENQIFDNLQTYLDLQQPEANHIEVQFQRLERHKLLTLSMKQHAVYFEVEDEESEEVIRQAAAKYNYVVIDRTFYYFITDVKYNNKLSVTFVLDLHIAQTFKDKFSLSSMCRIEREHVDRIGYNAGINKYYKIIDPVDEGFNIDYRILQSHTQVTPSDSYRAQNWYALYYSDTTDEASPVKTYLVPSTSFSGTFNLKSYTSDITIEANTLYILKASEHDGDVLTFNGTNYTISLGGNAEVEYVLFIPYNSSNALLQVYEITNNSTYRRKDTARSLSVTSSTLSFSFTTNVSNIYYTASVPNSYFYDYTTDTYVGMAEHKYLTINYYTSSTTATTTTTLTAFKDINRTDVHLVKVIKLPYFPFINLTADGTYVKNVSNSYNTFTCIEVKDSTSMTGSVLTDITTSNDIILPASLYGETPSVYYESKFDNSNYNKINLSYGSYTLDVKPEIRDLSNASYTLSISYTQAKLKSDLFFRTTYYTTVEGEEVSIGFKAGYNLDDPYALYLISDIDNEVPIYTSDYINYIKTGYNYDKDSVARQAVVSSIGSGIGFVAGIAGIAAAPATAGISAAAGISMISGTLQSTLSTINGVISGEAAIQKKITSYKNSSTGISGVNTVELRELYGSFKLYIDRWKLTPDLQSGLLNLWHKFGYASNRTGVPNTNTRIYFNYVKLKECYFDDVTNMSQYQEYLEDIKDMFLEGVYYYHLVNNDYSFNKEYENFEVALL